LPTKSPSEPSSAPTPMAHLLADETFSVFVTTCR